jgi:hypothetical protein
MSIQVAWGNDEQTIIAITYQQPWDWQEFEAAATKITALLDSVQQPVDLIFDVREGGRPPRGAIDRFRRTLKADHPNTRLVIFIGGQLIITSFLQTIFRVYGHFFQSSRIRFVDSKEEAYALSAQGRDRPAEASAL